MIQEQTPKLKPDFSHRFPAMGDDATPARMCDAVVESCDAAISFLHLISDEFVEEYIEAKGGRWNNQIMYAAIEGAINQIKDAKAFANAYYEASKKPKPSEPV